MIWKLLPKNLCHPQPDRSCCTLCIRSNTCYLVPNVTTEGGKKSPKVQTAAATWMPSCQSIPWGERHSHQDGQRWLEVWVGKLERVGPGILAWFSSLLCFDSLRNPIWLFWTAALLTLHFMLSWGSVINISSVDNETARKISNAAMTGLKPVNLREMPWHSPRVQIPAGTDAHLSFLHPYFNLFSLWGMFLPLNSRFSQGWMAPPSISHPKETFGKVLKSSKYLVSAALRWNLSCFEVIFCFNRYFSANR